MKFNFSFYSIPNYFLFHQTPLFLAVQNENKYIIELLVSHEKTDINFVNV